MAEGRTPPPSALGYIFQRRVLKRNLLVALVVGCLLTVANQFDVILSEPFTMRLGVKIFFNFLIPFTVSSVSAAINRTA
ncbi:MAG: hypothetical protein D6723_03895 [Acidobacteria bacterium]|nr:MAG: hypothetical protein D6723_03895 [Acidobacteriota bacterium]